MNKPIGYEEVTAPGEFIPVDLGGHTAVIKGLEETTSKNGRPMIKVAIDFDEQDSQPGYFNDLFQSDDRPEKKWPFNAVQYILTEDPDGKCSRSFKSFISSVERSCGSECVWGNGFARWFIGKKVGVVYGIVEEEYNGNVTNRRRIRFFCQYDKAKDVKVPEPKLLNNRPVPVNDGFMDIPDNMSGGVPF